MVRSKRDARAEPTLRIKSCQLAGSNFFSSSSLARLSSRRGMTLDHSSFKSVFSSVTAMRRKFRIAVPRVSSTMGSPRRTYAEQRTFDNKMRHRVRFTDKAPSDHFIGLGQIDGAFEINPVRILCLRNQPLTRLRQRFANDSKGACVDLRREKFHQQRPENLDERPAFCKAAQFTRDPTSSMPSMVELKALRIFRHIIRTSAVGVVATSALASSLLVIG